MSIYNKEIELGKKIAHGEISYEKAVPIMLEVARGNMLGDGSSGNYVKKGTPTGMFIQLVSSKREYIDHLYNIYKAWTTARIYDKHLMKDGSRRVGQFASGLEPQWAFISRVRTEMIEFINWRKPSTKPNRKWTKILPENIHSILTPRTLAYWFMDDGSLKNRNSFIISTDGFTKNETLVLIKILKHKFNISCREEYIKAKDQWRIYISSEGAYTMKKLIHPYIIPCFEYKLNLK